MPPQTPEVPPQSVPNNETLPQPEQITEQPQVAEVNTEVKAFETEKEIDLSSPIKGTSNQQISSTIAAAEEQIETSPIDPILEVRILEKDLKSKHGKIGPSGIFQTWKRLDDENKKSLGIENGESG